MYKMKLEDVKAHSPSKFVLFLDLDGVFADLTSYVESLLGRTIEVQEDGNWVNDNEVWKELRAKEEPQFDKLPMLPDAMELWNFTLPYQPNILTATGTPAELNGNMKRKWVQTNLPGSDTLDVITVQKSKMKANYAAPNCVLVDDRLKSVDPWRKAGGIAIHHKNAADTIAELKKLGF